MPEAPAEPAHAAPSPATAAQGLSISAVERDTGLTKDTLRVWERRYGFPRPLRDAQGERVYTGEQVGRLRLLRRLLVLGHRPGRVVGLAREQLEAMLAQHAAQGLAAAPAGTAALQRLLALLREHDPAGLQRELLQAQMRLGLQRFVVDLVAPLSTEVGAAWMRGELEVFEEHQFSEVLQRVLRGAIAVIPAAGADAPGRPRVLLTTIVHEPHGLGLLMAEAMLALEACHCVSLGVQTPLDDIVRAARAPGRRGRAELQRAASAGAGAGRPARAARRVAVAHRDLGRRLVAGAGARAGRRAGAARVAGAGTAGGDVASRARASLSRARAMRRAAWRGRGVVPILGGERCRASRPAAGSADALSTTRRTTCFPNTAT